MDGLQVRGFGQRPAGHGEETGFTAMERTTGWHGAIIAILMAQGRTPRGAKPVEVAVPGELFVEEMKKRGIPCTEKVTLLA